MIGEGHLVAGRYRLLSRIGGGGMGAVWLARDERLGREVAVKQVFLPVGSEPGLAEEQRQLALREGRMAARLHHPHAIAVYDALDDDGEPWLVMEHLPSCSLAEVTEQGVLPVDQVAQIGAQVADALAAAHRAGIVHRDVKPGNILVGNPPDAEGVVKITDFGIARARDDIRLTQTGIVKGTPAFLAPEVARGGEPGEPSDVFSLGATLFACLEGQPPFGFSTNSLELLYRVAAGDMDPPRRAGPLTEPLLAMLAPDPAARPTMAEVRDQLAGIAARRSGDVTAVLSARTLLQPVPPGAGAPDLGPDSLRTPTRTGLPAAAAAAARTRPPAADPPPWAPVEAAPPAHRRPRWPLVVAALVLLALVAGGIAWALDRSGTPDTTTASPTTTAVTASTTTASPTTTAAPTTTSAAPTTTEPPPTTVPTTTPPPAPPPVTGDDVEAAISDYYALLPDDVEAAYALTGPTLQGRSSLGDYSAFFSTFDEVELRSVEAADDGSLTATAEVTFRWRKENGNGNGNGNGRREETEQHLITLVQGEDGRLLVDVDQYVATIG